MPRLSIVTKQKHTTKKKYNTYTECLFIQNWNCEVPLFINNIAKMTNLSKKNSLTVRSIMCECVSAN